MQLIDILTITVTMLVAIACYFKLGDLQRKQDRLTPTNDIYISARTAFKSSDAKYKQTAIEDHLYKTLKANPKFKGLTRDEVRGIRAELGKLYRSLTPDQLIAQAKEMQNWA